MPLFCHHQHGRKRNLSHNSSFEWYRSVWRHSADCKQGHITNRIKKDSHIKDHRWRKPACHDFTQAWVLQRFGWNHLHIRHCCKSLFPMTLSLYDFNFSLFANKGFVRLKVRFIVLGMNVRCKKMVCYFSFWGWSFRWREAAWNRVLDPKFPS